MHRRPWAGWYGGLFLLVAPLLGGAASAVGQTAPRVEARVSADSVKIGERFALTLVAAHDTATSARFPSADARSGLFGDLHVVERGPIQSRRPSATRRVDSVSYTVTTFALDSARVPILPVRLVTGGDTTVAGSFPHVVPVKSVVGPDAEGLRAPALLATFPRPAWWWTGLVLLGAVLLAGGAYGWWRRQSLDDAEAEESTEEKEHPYKAASTRLQRLERRNPTGREACKAFYVDLTETLRVYLAQRVGVRALEQTTTEMLAALRRHPEVQEVVLRRLETVLKQADLVKFADAQPDPAESRAVLQDAQGVLDALEAAQRRSESTDPTEESAPAEGI